MSTKPVLLAGLTVALFGLTNAAAAAVPLRTAPGADTDMVVKVHSVYRAEASLYRRGYYDVRLERPTLPYSFNACKRGVRYHVHVDYYGDLVQVDPIGQCYERAYGPRIYAPRPYSEGYRRPYYPPYRRPYYERYRGDY
jgi:hypothetical protein